MARLAFSLALIFFFFTFTNAVIPIDNYVNVAAYRDSSNSQPESDAGNPTLLLPTDNPVSDLTTMEPQPVEKKPINDGEVTDGKVDGITEDLPVSDQQTAKEMLPDDRPLTIVRIRQVNRHFPEKRPYFIRVPHRDCHNRMNTRRNARIQRGEISYGDDVILSGENGDFDQEIFHGAGRQIPTVPMKFRGHRHGSEGMQRFPFMNQQMFVEQRLGRVGRPFQSQGGEGREENHHQHQDMLGEPSFRRSFRREEGEKREENRHQQHDMLGQLRFRRTFHLEEGEGREEDRHHHHDDMLGEHRRTFHLEEGEGREENRHHHHHEFRRDEGEEGDLNRQNMFRNMRFGRPFRQEEEELREQKGPEERPKGGFLGSFRKFLNQF